ncbi:MAG: hypothetical protein JST76_00185 [Bacteroidetes bacterium]|nr:hypothetical protein [Bacteroidota bacterium]
MSDQITPQPKSTKAKRPVRLFILVSEGTISRAEYFAAILRTYHSGATVIGTHTVGAMGEMVRLPLYGDLSMSFTCGEVTFDGVSYFKKGIAPDILVHLQPADLLTGTDRILQTAIDLAHGSQH